VRSAAAIAITVLAGCEVLFPLSGSDRTDGPLGPPDDGSPPPVADARIDADPADPDAMTVPAFCPQPGAFICYDFESPATGLPFLAQASQGPAPVIDELPPDALRPSRTLRTRIGVVNNNVTSYAVAWGTIPLFEFNGRIRVWVRSSQADMAACEPDVLQIPIGPNAEVHIAIQAMGAPTPGYRLRFDSPGGSSSFMAHPAILTAWHEITVVVDGPAGQVSFQLDGGGSSGVTSSDITGYAEIAQPQYHVGVGLVGPHDDCEFRFDDMTIESF
jgi:hypothetical protein